MSWLGQHELQVPYPNSTCLEDIETGTGYQLSQLARLDLAVTMEVSERTTSMRRIAAELDDQQPAAPLQHAPHFSDAGFARWPRQVMEHHGVQNDIEASMGVRQRLGNAFVEFDVDAGFHRFSAGSRDHRGGCIDPVNFAGTDVTLGCNRQTAGPASDVQNRFVRLETCGLEQLLAQPAFPA